MLLFVSEPSIVNAEAMLEEEEDQDLKIMKQKALERRRLQQLHRQLSKELDTIEKEFLQASINKLRREAAERSADWNDDFDFDADIESMNSDLRTTSAASADVDDSLNRQRKRSSCLLRLDEKPEIDLKSTAGKQHTLPSKKSFKLSINLRHERKGGIDEISTQQTIIFQCKYCLPLTTSASSTTSLPPLDPLEESCCADDLSLSA